MIESIQDRDERAEIRTRSLQSSVDSQNKAVEALERNDWGSYAFHTLNAATYAKRADLYRSQDNG